MKVDDIVKNIVNTISSFSTKLVQEVKTLNTKGVADTANKEMKKLTSFIEGFSEMADATKNVAESADAFDRLATSIGSLTNSIQRLNVEKFKLIGNIASGMTLGSGVTAPNKPAPTVPAANTAAAANNAIAPVAETQRPQQVEIDVDKLAIAVGDAVAAAFKSGQFTFQFVDQDKGVLNFSG